MQTRTAATTIGALIYANASPSPPDC